MNLRNYFTHFAVGFGLSFSVVPAVAQQQAASDADAAESAGMITSPRDAAVKWKGFAPVPQAANRSAGAVVRRQAWQQRPEQRRESRPGSGQTFRSSSLLGTAITDANGQVIGKVVDFVTDGQGNILYPLISYSGTPGFSGRVFAVPRGSLRFAPGSGDGSTAQLSFEPLLLQNAPSFASGQFSALNEPVFQNRLNAYYQSVLLPSNNSKASGGAMNTMNSSLVNPPLPLTGGVADAQAAGFSTQNGTLTPVVTAGGTSSGPLLFGFSGLPAGASAQGQGVIPPSATGSIIGPSGSPAGSSFIGGNVPGGSATTSITGPSGVPGGSTLPGGSMIGPSGSPAGTSPSAGNNTSGSALFPASSFGAPGSGQLFPQSQPSAVGPSATPNSTGPSATPNANGPSATPSVNGPSATPSTTPPSAVPNSMGATATPTGGGGTSPAGK